MKSPSRRGRAILSHQTFRPFVQAELAPRRDDEEDVRQNHTATGRAGDDDDEGSAHRGRFATNIHITARVFAGAVVVNICLPSCLRTVSLVKPQRTYPSSSAVASELSEPPVVAAGAPRYSAGCALRSLASAHRQWPAMTAILLRSGNFLFGHALTAPGAP